MDQVKQCDIGTRVVHCKKEHYDVYIGRPSKWGNPFQIGKDGTREEVIQKYREYIKSRCDLLNQLHELRGKILGCWCKPLECHGDVLVELCEEPTDEESWMQRKMLWRVLPYMSKG